MPESFRLEFLADNTNQRELNDWIARLLREISFQPQDSVKIEDTEGKKSELLYLCETCVRRLKYYKHVDPCLWSDGKVPDHIRLLQNIGRLCY